MSDGPIAIPSTFKGRPEEYRPPRGYSWEKFRAGNTLALRHGGHSEAVIEPLAKALAAWLVETFPILDSPGWFLGVNALAQSEARAAVFRNALDEVGANHKTAATLNKMLTSAENRASIERDKLPISDVSKARLSKEISEADLAQFSVDHVARQGAVFVVAQEERARQLDQADTADTEQAEPLDPEAEPEAEQTNA